MCTCEPHTTTTEKRYQSSQQLTHSKSRQQRRDLREGVSNKRKRNDEASYRPDSNPELIHEQDATLHIGNDGSPGPASEGAAAKSDDRTTLTNRLSGDTKISPLTTQQQVGKPQYRRLNIRDMGKHLQESADTSTDTTMPPFPIVNYSAAYRFALNPAARSACITITEYDVLGRQLMNGHDDKGYW